MDDFLLSYLPTALRKLESDSETEVTFVLGNETCDLDSAICAIVLSHALKSHAGPSARECFIPILNIPRKDVSLKTEVVFCVGEEKLKNVACRDEVEISPRAKLILVDHHVLLNKDRGMVENVAKIFDHREVDKENFKFSGDKCDVIIEPVGSCATLIAEHCLNNLGYQDNKGLDFLRSTILTDTKNLLPSAGKVTPRDVDAVTEIERKLGDYCKESRSSTFDKIFAAKSDISGLSARQILRKDLKVIALVKPAVKIAIPSILTTVEIVAGKTGDFGKLLDEFCAANDAEMCIILGAKMSDDGDMVGRQVFAYAWKTAAKSMVNVVVDGLRDKVQMTEISSSAPNICKIGRFYSLKNIAMSRKKLVPLIKTGLEN